MVARRPGLKSRSSPSESRVAAGRHRRIFGAHAAYLRCCDLRSSLAHQRMRALRCSAAPSIWTTWSPNLSPRFPAVTLVYALAYLLAAVLFILGLRQLSSPKTARNGNFTAAAGMVIALGATVPQLHFTAAGAIIIVIGVVIGAVVGTIGARQVKMTQIPQMVALFNGAGGGAAALVAGAGLLKVGPHPPLTGALARVFSNCIGSVSFSGRPVAVPNVPEVVNRRATHIPVPEPS